MASRVSGTAVYRGQTITLSTETEDATIYYTTDGTCPCESASRIKYERPIIINDGITIKAMAVGVTAAESETSEFTYQIRQSDVKLDLVEGWNWNAHDLSTSLPITEFSDVASRILTQTEEAVKDDNLAKPPVSVSIQSLRSRSPVNSIILLRLQFICIRAGTGWVIRLA